jgi:hypothetical protein
MQDAEKARQLRSRKTQPPHHLGGVHERAALYSARREPQWLNVPQGKSSTNCSGSVGEKDYASLRPLLKDFLSILNGFEVRILCSLLGRYIL